MVKNSVPPLVFFGTGPVAAQCLELLNKVFAIEAVITKPKAVSHRGSSPVLEVAEAIGCKVLTASSKKELDTVFAHKPVHSTVAVLIDFGIIVSQHVIDYFPLGIINSHFSVLPDLRGADPITFAILSGQKETGVSLMYLVEAMDEGPLLDYATYTLPDSITTPELTQELIAISHRLLTSTLPRVFAHDIKAQPQTITGRTVSYSRKLTKQDGAIDFTQYTAVELERQIRAYVGWPGSSTAFGHVEVLITKARAVTGNMTPGTQVIEKKSLSVACREGLLEIERIKPLGKSEMGIAAFLAGYRARIQ